MKNIYDSSGKLIKHGNFAGSEYKMTPELVPGLYFVRYKDMEGKPAFVKIIKL